MDDNQRRLDAIRRGSDENGNHVIDEFVAGRLSRGDFLRRGAVVGLSMPLMAAIVAACGGANNAEQLAGLRWERPGQAGRHDQGRHHHALGCDRPGHRRRPGRPGHARARRASTCASRTRSLQLVPVLAESWTANTTADVWTFKIRQGVKFHNGQPLTADDVVYTYKLQTDPKGKSNALSAFGGMLLPAGRAEGGRLHRRIPPRRAEREFPVPVLVRQLQHDHPAEQLRPLQVGVELHRDGAVQDEELHAQGGRVVRPQRGLLGHEGAPRRHRVHVLRRPAAARSWRCRAGTIDVIGQFSVSGGQALLSNSSVTVINLKSSAHRELSMRCDQAPFTDPRVRQAVALTLNRPEIIQGLFQGKADLGNDSPFAPVFPSTDTSVAAAGAGPEQGQAAALRRRGTAAASRPSSSPRTSSRSRSWPRS